MSNRQIALINISIGIELMYVSKVLCNKIVFFNERSPRR